MSALLVTNDPKPAMIRTLALLSVAAALSGCASERLLTDRETGRHAIVVNSHALVGTAPFCVWGLDVKVDDRPYAVNPLPANKSLCANKTNKNGEFVSGTAGSFFPLADYKRITVSLRRTEGGAVETYTLDISGKMLSNQPPHGARVGSLNIQTSQTGVKAVRVDSGPRYYQQTVIADTEVQR